MPQGKAHCYKMWPEEGNSEQVLLVLKAAAKKRSPISFDHGKQKIIVCEQRIHSVKGQDVYTASAFRVREGAYPSIVEPSGVKPLELHDHEGLGEPMCFAYDPIDGNAVMLWSQNGPKPSSLHAFLEEIGFPHKMSIEPILRHDMKQRLERTRFVQSLHFKIKDAPNADYLRTAGAPVEMAIGLADSINGTDISVTVSIGRQREGLALGVVKKVAGYLCESGDTHLGQLVLNASQDDDVKCYPLDLLNARVEIMLDLTDEVREINRKDCQRQLVKILKEILPGIIEKKP
jgi:hypothetical protein